MKTCTACNETKPLDAFARKGAGLQSKCKVCAAAWARQYRAEHPAAVKLADQKSRAKHADRVRARMQSYRQANKVAIEAKIKEWRVAHADHVKARRRAWFARSELAQALSRFYRAQRRAVRLAATPAWSEAAAIREVYALAKFLTDVTGEQHHVDHIVPLQSPLVCGLHVAANLRVVRASDNLAKGNRFIEVAA
jgi:hypothetical protein